MTKDNNDRWKKTCPAQKFLISLWDKGIINSDSTPKSVYNQYPQFKDHHTSDAFRRAFLRLKAERSSKLIVVFYPI